jgi:Tol biopolymer transport system component
MSSSETSSSVTVPEPRPLTRDGARKIAPVFIDGGDAIVYAVHERPNLVALVRLDWRRGTRERVLPKVVNHQFDPTYSADGKFLAYARTTTSPQSDLVIREWRAEREVTFRPRDSRATVRHPCFAPDGSRVAFGLSDEGGQQVATVDLKGQGLAILAASAGISGWPSYSPDGKRIAFASSRDGDFEIYTMDSDGAHIRRLTHSRGRDLRPVWSSDGRRIAFSSTRDGNEEIYVMTADGSEPRNVTNHPDRDTDAAWHPDGRRLAFVSDRGGQYDIYMIEL